MISSDWNHDTVVSRFVTARLSSLAKTDNTIPGFSLPFDREFVSEHKLFEPIPHHRVSQILFLFGRHNEMWVRVRIQSRYIERLVADDDPDVARILVEALAVRKRSASVH